MTLILLFAMAIVADSQTIRFFEFTASCGHGNWQDTSFIASTSDEIVIDTVLSNLTRPISQRKFINGNIDYGNGGFNHNASHWFLWHFIPNQWTLAELAVEVCDGCPYSDVDADTAYWVGNLGRFCPWSGKPVREIPNPEEIRSLSFEDAVLFFPNPASDKLFLKNNFSDNIKIVIYNDLGQEIKTIPFSKQNENIEIDNLRNGIYFLKTIDGCKVDIKKIVVQK